MSDEQNDKQEQLNENGAAATTPQATENAPAKRQTKPPADSIGGMIEKLKPQIERALPKHVTADRLARVALTAVRNNPSLQQADAYSLMGSIMQSAQLGLEPNTPLGHCYIIPYRNGKTGETDAQFQMGYQGLIELASRAGVQVAAHVVDEADEFAYSLGLGKSPHHVPADTPSGNVTHYWAEYMLSDGRYNFAVWSKEQVTQHMKRYSKGYDRKDSAWQTAFDAMAKKTVIIDLLKYAPKAVEVAEATAADNRSYRVNPEDPDLHLEATDADFNVTE